VNLRRTAFLTAFAALVAAANLAVVSCAESDTAKPPDAHGNGSGGTSGNGTGSTGAIATGASTAVLSTGGTDPDAGIVACQAQSEPARLTPVNIVFMIDKSGSMGAQDVDGDGLYTGPNEWDNTANRWAPVSAALIAFFRNPGAEGLKASLEFFPDGGDPTGPNTGACSVSKYAYPSVLLQSLDDPTGQDLLATRIESTTPTGGTPTLPALQGALEYARQAMADDPSSRSVVVLVTDGEPGVARVDRTTGEYFNEKCFCYGEAGCPDQDEIPYIAQAAAAGAADGIPTYVIGMGEVDEGNLNTIAAAGSTERAFIVELGDPAQTQAQLTEALGSVRSVQAPCNIAMPAPPEDETFDKLKVNVEFVPGSGVAVPLYYAGSLAAQLGGTQLSCPNPGPPAPTNPWFWTYDNEDNPSQIILCASACAQTEGDAAGVVNVAYGCVTEVPPVR
jgi:hypothetical protein